jgi:Arc/MetJ family transcription regulator
MRTNIVLEGELVAEAMALTGARTKREVVNLALRELVRRRKRRSLLDLSGQIQFAPGFDHKELRRLRDAAG